MHAVTVYVLDCVQTLIVAKLLLSVNLSNLKVKLCNM